MDARTTLDQDQLMLEVVRAQSAMGALAGIAATAVLTCQPCWTWTKLPRGGVGIAARSFVTRLPRLWTRRRSRSRCRCRRLRRWARPGKRLVSGAHGDSAGFRRPARFGVYVVAVRVSSVNALVLRERIRCSVQCSPKPINIRIVHITVDEPRVNRLLILITPAFFLRPQRKLIG